MAVSKGALALIAIGAFVTTLAVGGRNAESIAMTGWPDLFQMLPKDIQEHHDMSQQGGRYRLKLQGWLVKGGWKPIADRPEVEPFIFVKSIQHARIVRTNTP